MQKSLFKPNLLDPIRLIFFFLAFIPTIVTAAFVIPKVITLSRLPELAAAMNEVLFILGLGIVFSAGLMLLFIVPLLHKKIVIDGDLLYLFNKSILASPEMKVFNLKKIKRIRDGTTTSVAAKVIFVQYFWSFSLQDNAVAKVYLSGWDKLTLSKVLLHIKKHHSDILIDTAIYRDSSEVLAGLHELGK